MLIKARVIPKSKENQVILLNKQEFKIKTTALPSEGKANQMIIKMLSKYFKVAKSNIKIIKGKKTKNKIIEIV